MTVNPPNNTCPMFRIADSVPGFYSASRRILTAVIHACTVCMPCMPTPRYELACGDHLHLRLISARTLMFTCLADQPASTTYSHHYRCIYPSSLTQNGERLDSEASRKSLTAVSYTASSAPSLSRASHAPHRAARGCARCRGRGRHLCPRRMGPRTR